VVWWCGGVVVGGCGGVVVGWWVVVGLAMARGTGTEGQTYRQAEGQRGRGADRHTDRHTDRHIDI
jgi:hypothetical protein